MPTNNRLILWLISAILVLTMFFMDIDHNFDFYKSILGAVFVITFYSLHKKNLLLRYFLLFFFLFFLSALMFVGDINELKSSNFYKGFSVTTSHIENVYHLIAVYLLSVGFMTVIYNDSIYDEFKTVEHQEIKNFSILIVVLMLMAAFTFNFYVLKIIAVQQEGYLAYHTGQLSVKKGIFFIATEMIFLAVLYWFMYHRSKIGIALFFVYNFLVLMTGFRMPFLCNMLVFLLIFYPVYASKFKLIFISFFFAPPVLILSQRYRMGKFPTSLTSLMDTVAGSYAELFSILSFTLDTIKSAVFLHYDTDKTSSIFYSLTALFAGLYKKIHTDEYLSVLEKADYGSFAIISTLKINPELVAKGITAGSSFLSEVFLPFGFIGVIGAGFFHVIFVQKLQAIFYQRAFLGFLSIIVLAPYFLRSARSGFIDWFFVSAIYIAIFYSLIVGIQYLNKFLSDSIIRVRGIKNS